MGTGNCPEEKGGGDIATPSNYTKTKPAGGRTIKRGNKEGRETERGQETRGEQVMSRKEN